MFVVIFFLFEFEDVMNEELLKILIGIVDAQLFETIALEILETKDIQDTEAKPRHESIEWRVTMLSLPLSVSGWIFRFENSRVDLFHNPDEHLAVDAFDECITTGESYGWNGHWLRLSLRTERRMLVLDSTEWRPLRRERRSFVSIIHHEAHSPRARNIRIVHDAGCCFFLKLYLE